MKRFETAVLFSWGDGDIGDAEAWVARSALAAAIGGIAEAGAMECKEHGGLQHSSAGKNEVSGFQHRL